jgi:two-component system, OmpR family, sensor kinase
MAGGQRRRPHSLTLQLSAWIGGMVAAVGIIACILSFTFAYQEARALQDGQLDEIATLIDHHALALTGDQTSVESSRTSPVKVVIDRLTDAAVTRGAGVVIAAAMPDGFHDLDGIGQRWRVNVRTLKSGERIAVAEPSALRDEIARDGAMRTLVPVLLLMPGLLVVVVVIVRRKLALLTRLAAVVDRQSDVSLAPLSEENLSTEVLPFIRSINSLLSRLKDAIGHQRRFVASAAHELRSPLAALSLQAGNLAATITSADARERLSVFQAGLRRTQRLVEQLLALARSEQGTLERPAPMSLTALVAGAINASIALAQAKNIDLGIEKVDDVEVVADFSSMDVVLRNLVDNAVRYTPDGGKVDVSAIRSADQLMLEVTDTGPGIPDEELERVREPFYRANHSGGVAGSGLGLSIVSEIARRAGGRLLLENIDGGFRVGYVQLLPAMNHDGRCERGNGP